MKKLDYLYTALKAQCFLERSWIISAFALTHEGPDDWKKQPYPYRIVATPTGYSYVDETGSNLVSIEDAVAGEPLFDRRTQITITPNEAPNLTEPTLETSVGRLLYNWLMVIYPFGNKLPYFNQTKTDVDKIIESFLPKWFDGGPGVSNRGMNTIYTEDYLKFCEAGDYLRGFTQLWVPGITEKAITAPAGLVEYKNQLFKEFEGRLHEPTIIAMINEKLVKFDAANLKGDRSEGFLISGKSRDIVRRKLYLMNGAEPGLEDKVDLDLIKNSLSQGWEVDKFPSMIDTVRSGSYQRGAETMLGGEAVKWLMRASSNLAVKDHDCGSVMGMPTKLTEENVAHYFGFHVVENGQPVEINIDNSAELIARKSVLVRSPQFCMSTLTDYCEICVGPRLRLNKTGISASITGQGSKLMLLSMGGAHAKALMLQRMDFKEAIT